MNEFYNKMYTENNLRTRETKEMSGTGLVRFKDILIERSRKRFITDKIYEVEFSKPQTH